MMIKVCGVVGSAFQNYYPEHNNREVQTKYYEPKENKQNVKNDFGMVLDAEMKKLHFDKII